MWKWSHIHMLFMECPFCTLLLLHVSSFQGCWFSFRGSFWWQSWHATDAEESPLPWRRGCQYLGTLRKVFNVEISMFCDLWIGLFMCKLCFGLPHGFSFHWSLFQLLFFNDGKETVIEELQKWTSDFRNFALPESKGTQHLFHWEAILCFGV